MVLYYYKIRETIHIYISCRSPRTGWEQCSGALVYKDTIARKDCHVGSESIYTTDTYGIMLPPSFRDSALLQQHEGYCLVRLLAESGSG